MGRRGVAQYEVNQFVQAVRRLGISWEQLDDFTSRFVFPPGRGRLGSFHWEERVVSGEDSHIKAFASETLNLIVVLATFGRLVLQPKQVLPQHVRSMRLLQSLSAFLIRWDWSRQDPTTFLRLNEEHHKLFMELYAPCAKPKLHYCWHLYDCLVRFGTMLTCFAGERKHRWGKRLGGFCFRNMAQTILVRDLGRMLHHFSLPGTFSVITLLERERPDPRRPGWHKGSAMRGPAGIVSIGELVRWRSRSSGPSSSTTEARPDEKEGRGEVLQLLRGPDHRHFVTVSLYQEGEGGLCSPAGRRASFMADELLPSQPYLQHEGGKLLCEGV